MIFRQAKKAVTIDGPPREFFFLGSRLVQDLSPSRIQHFWFSKEIDGVEQVTPRNVAEGKSNLSRVIYPATKTLYDGGVLNIDDSYI
jgi:hypothetical protein